MATGTRLGRYLLRRRVGAGGMAEVWEAFDEGLHRSVAVKVIREEIAGQGEFKERFVREARLAAGLEHPRILPIYDFGSDGAVAYLVMPLLPGGSLKDRIRGPLPPRELVDALASVAAALDFAHARGVLHRDVKPSNVLADHSGGFLLSDFGLAKSSSLNAELTAAGAVLGTPAYMAPEQAAGRAVDPRTDQYALGVVAFELLTGRTPFRAETPFGVLDAHIRTPPPPPSTLVPSLSPGVDAVLARVLAKGPDSRFPSCAAFVEALSQALGLPLLAATLPGSGVRGAPPVPLSAPAGASLGPTRVTPVTMATPPQVRPALQAPTELVSTSPPPPPLPPPRTPPCAPPGTPPARRPASSGSRALPAFLALGAVVLLLVAGSVFLLRPLVLGRTGPHAPVEPTPVPSPAPEPSPAPVVVTAVPVTTPEPGHEPAPEPPMYVEVHELALPTAPPRETPASAPRPRPTAARTPERVTEVRVDRAAEPEARPPRPAEKVGERTVSLAEAARGVEQLLPFRPGEAVPIGLRVGTATLEEVRLGPGPGEREVARADAGDRYRLRVVYVYSNTSPRGEYDCLYDLSLLDAEGRVLGGSSRSASLNKDQRHDTNGASVRLRTLDVARVRQLRLRVTIVPD